MATPKKLPSGMWRVQVYGGKDSNGKTIRKSITADSKKKCSLLAAQYEAGIREKDKAGMTVREAIQTYIDSKTNILSPSTIRGYRGELRTHLQDIMDIPLGKLTQVMVQASINRQSESCSPKTIRNCYGLLMASLNAIYPTISFNCTLPQKIKPDIHIPTQEDVQKLIDNAKTFDVKLAILLASSMGLRRSEICGLTWDNIHLPFRKLTISQAKVLNGDSDFVVKSTKTYSGTRTLDIPDIILKELNTIEDKTGFLLKITPTALSRSFDRGAKKAGVKCRFHDLRHYYASVLLMLGIPDKYAAERMGHASTDMLRKVYQHTFDDVQKNFSSKVNTFLSNTAHESAHEKIKSLKNKGL